MPTGTAVAQQLCCWPGMHTARCMKLPCPPVQVDAQRAAAAHQDLGSNPAEEGTTRAAMSRQTHRCQRRASDTARRHAPSFAPSCTQQHVLPRATNCIVHLTRPTCRPHPSSQIGRCGSACGSLPPAWAGSRPQQRCWHARRHGRCHDSMHSARQGRAGHCLRKPGRLLTSASLALPVEVSSTFDDLTAGRRASMNASLWSEQKHGESVANSLVQAWMSRPVSCWLLLTSPGQPPSGITSSAAPAGGA